MGLISRVSSRTYRYFFIMKLTILYPTGHRVVLSSITPMTSVNTILTDSNNQRKFPDGTPNNYGLKISSRKLLSTNTDMSLTVRTAGISNNSVLELVKIDLPRANDEKIRIAVQLPNGQRHITVGTQNWSLGDI